MIVDLKDLKKIINQKIITKIDHNSLNEVDFMKNIIPTTENLCIQIWHEIKEPIKMLGGKLYIKLELMKPKIIILNILVK